jgi:hypothetical protein
MMVRTRGVSPLLQALPSLSSDPIIGRGALHPATAG